jgi:hypothetical protein
MPVNFQKIFPRQDSGVQKSDVEAQPLGDGIEGGHKISEFFFGNCSEIFEGSEILYRDEAASRKASKW